VWNSEFELIAAEHKTRQKTEYKWFSKQMKYSQIDNEDIVSVLLVYCMIQASLCSVNLQISRNTEYVFEKRNNENMYIGTRQQRSTGFAFQT
jgi:hypothetical protein